MSSAVAADGAGNGGFCVWERERKKREDQNWGGGGSVFFGHPSCGGRRGRRKNGRVFLHECQEISRSRPLSVIHLLIKKRERVPSSMTSHDDVASK